MLLEVDHPEMEISALAGGRLSERRFEGVIIHQRKLTQVGV